MPQVEQKDAEGPDIRKCTLPSAGICHTIHSGRLFKVDFVLLREHSGFSLPKSRFKRSCGHNRHVTNQEGSEYVGGEIMRPA